MPYARVRGDTLTLRAGFSLPAMCCKCGRHDALHVRREEFTHSPGWSYPLFLLGLLPGVLVVALLARSATMPLPICDACDARWRGAAALRALLLVVAAGVGLGIAVAGLWLGTVELVAVGVPVLLFVPSLIWVVLRLALVPRVMIAATSISDQAITMRGLSPQVLAAYARA